MGRRQRVVVGLAFNVRFCSGSVSSFLAFGAGPSGRASPCLACGGLGAGCGRSGGRVRVVAGCDEFALGPGVPSESDASWRHARLGRQRRHRAVRSRSVPIWSH